MLEPLSHPASDASPAPREALPIHRRPEGAKPPSGPPGLSPLETLGERIAELAAQISAATYELLVMLRDFDERGGWNGGFRSCAHWLNWRAGIDLGAAREKVRVARALAALPRLSESMRRGELSYAKVRALTRIATPANEQELLHFARAGTASHVEKLVRSMRLVDRLEAHQREERRHEGRYLRAYTDEDGMVVVAARLAPEAGAALLRALDAGVERLYGPRRMGAEDGTSAPRGAAEETTAEQRRADALGVVAESALGAGLDPGTRGDRYQVVVHVDAEALVEVGRRGRVERTGRKDVSAETCGALFRSSGAQRAGDLAAEIAGAEPELAGAKIRRDVSAETWEAPGEAGGTERSRDVSAETSEPDPAGNCTLDGTRVSAETCRRLACDAALVVMRHAPDGSVLDVGRRTRAISPALRRALDHRDGGCRFPGCGLKLCDGHHVEHWADGGETKLGNTLLLCRRHHRAVQRRGSRWSCWRTGRRGSIGPMDDGSWWRRRCRRWPRSRSVRWLARLARSAASTSSRRDPPSWDGGPCDYGWAVDWLRSLDRQESRAGC